jgi:hypothetical protein
LFNIGETLMFLLVRANDCCSFIMVTNHA